MSPRDVPPALAHRIDRLARRAHLFHRYAHHPLCVAYAAETVRLGRRTRICRGCLAAGLGAAVGIALALAVRPLPGSALLGAAPLLAALLLGAVRPRRGRASSKLATRGAPAACATAVAVLGLRCASAPGLAAAAAALALTAWAVQAYRRRGPDRRPCAACPERSRPTACSGLAPIARREAAFARAAGRLLRAVPPPPATR